MSRFCLALALLLTCLSTAHGWGGQGHRLIANIADAHLSPTARAEVARLLQGEPEPSLAGVSTWADTIRDDEAWRWTAPMHYVKFDDSTCVYDAERACRDDLCVVGAIERYSRVLADRTLPDEARLEALKFLVHFIGDVHQPLHAGHRPDRGGNDFQVNIAGEGTNLHAVWDRRVLPPESLEPAQHLPAREAAVGTLPDAGSAEQWASESCRLTASKGFYPDKPGRLPQGYLDRVAPMAAERANLAAKRLAVRLNSLLTD